MPDDNYDAYDFQDVPVDDNYDAYDFQDVPVDDNYDAYDFQGGGPDYTNGNYGSPTPGGVGGNYGNTGGSGGLSSLFRTLGLVKGDGSVNWGMLAGLGGAAASLAGGPSYKPRSPAQLLASLPSNTPAFTPGAMAPMRAGTGLPTVSAASMSSPIQPGQRYAEGGEVGPLSAVFQGPGLVSGDASGQSDTIPAQLSAGEYVFDAESVSMLGDGNNAAGAKRLDELRENLRAHKRSAPDDDIAPPAQGALSYLSGGGVQA